jgi:1-acyl-sn-glycerol-3-phosphate acyltransferase
MKQTVGRLVVRALRYRIEGGPPPADPVCVLVGAPHTSWLDFPLMLGIAWANDLSPHFLAKQEMFRPPFGAVMRGLGGLPVDRQNPGTLVADLVARASAGEPLALVVAPEGTRGHGTHWKSGFYRIAEEAKVPIALTYLDGPTRTGGFGPSLHPSGDVRADMDLVRAFYADKRGVRPERRTPAVLREEGPDAP